MNRKQLYEYIAEVKEPKKDYSKLLSNLHYTHFYLVDRYNKIFVDYNLSFTQGNVLGIVAHFHPKAVSLEEIKEMVLEQNSDVSRTVSRLAEKGFVQKLPNESNRRKVAIV